MTRPAPDADAPFTRQQIATMTAVPAPTVQRLAIEFLNKPNRGSGHYLGFTLDDAIRIAVAKSLLRVGVLVASLHGLFEAIEISQIPAARRWAWLRTEEARTTGAVLLLFLAPRTAPTNTGAVVLTTLADALALLTSKPNVIVIDVNEIIQQIEAATGQS